MIRQELGPYICEERPCRRCCAAGDRGRRERLASRLAAAAFLLCGLAVVLLDGGLPAAVLLGLLAGGTALALTLAACEGRTRRRLRACGGCQQAPAAALLHQN